MEMLRGAYERDRKLKNAKAYTFVRKQQIGNVERNVFVKDSNEYVKHNGKFMKLKNYKELMKSKNLYKSPSPQKSPSLQKLSSPKKPCKKDCSLIKKVCNNKTGRCNKPKVSKKKV